MGLNLVCHVFDCGRHTRHNNPTRPPPMPYTSPHTHTLSLSLPLSLSLSPLHLKNEHMPHTLLLSTSNPIRHCPQQHSQHLSPHPTPHHHQANMSQEKVDVPSYKKGANFSDAVYNYISDLNLRETDEQVGLRKATAALGRDAVMQGSPDEAKLFQFLFKLANVKTMVEVGVFTGYTTLTCALALPEDGKIYGLDVSDDYANVGKPFWEKAGVANKIDLRIAPAADSLDKLVEEGLANTIDFAFIDADKVNYGTYYEKLLKLLRPGGFIAIDNTIWGGKVVDPKATDEDTSAIKALNEKVANDDRVFISMLGIADGVTLALKK